MPSDQDCEFCGISGKGNIVGNGTYQIRTEIENDGAWMWMSFALQSELTVILYRDRGNRT
jgi:hypothetical protein